MWPDLGMSSNSSYQGRHIQRIAYKHHLSIKEPTANEMRQEVGGGTLAGTERILGESERMKGDPGRERFRGATERWM